MLLETITDQADLLIRKMTLAPGEAMYWHADQCQRFSVVIHGEELTIEYRDNGDKLRVPVAAGMCGWDQPEPRVHRAINSGRLEYCEIVTFYRNDESMEPQPQDL